MIKLPVDVLVNKEFGIDIGYEPDDLITLDENQNNFHNYFDPNEKPSISLRIYPAYKRLEYASMADGLHVVVGSGYRSGLYQERLFDSVLEKYFNEYKELYKNASEAKLFRMAFERAKAQVAQPGHSEHQTGYAFDCGLYRNGIYVDTFTGTDESVWMNENAYKYGFILRYPKGKEKITGYNSEPWHYRYVGEDISSVIYNDGDWLTLEEYNRGLVRRR